MENLIISGNWGYLDIPEPHHIYDARYFSNYLERAKTKIGRDITEFRVDLVESYSNSVIDIGIGAGIFLQKCLENNMTVFGYDIMPASIKWLTRRGLFWDVFKNGLPSVKCMTFFDCLEHFTAENANRLLEIAKGITLVISVPIYNGYWDNISEWRHWKPMEHLQYWRKDGFIDWMEERGFILQDRLFNETELGRLDIETYVFN